jgi:hypothetical protein
MLTIAGGVFLGLLAFAFLLLTYGIGLLCAGLISVLLFYGD